MATRKYQNLDDLSEWAASRVRKLRPNDAETWTFEPVPALDNTPFIDMMNRGEDGEHRVRRYLTDLMGKFFP
jgi:hypothetical protein